MAPLDDVLERGCLRLAGKLRFWERFSNGTLSELPEAANPVGHIFARHFVGALALRRPSVGCCHWFLSPHSSRLMSQTFDAPLEAFWTLEDVAPWRQKETAVVTVQDGGRRADSGMSHLK